MFACIYNMSLFCFIVNSILGRYMYKIKQTKHYLFYALTYMQHTHGNQFVLALCKGVSITY